MIQEANIVNLISYNNIIMITASGVLFMLIQTRSFTSNPIVTLWMITGLTMNFLSIIHHEKIAILVVVVNMLVAGAYASFKPKQKRKQAKLIDQVVSAYNNIVLKIHSIV